MACAVLKHIHVELDALLIGAGARCLVLDADADMDERTGALAVDATTLMVTLRLNGGDMFGGGPYVTVGPAHTDEQAPHAPRCGANGSPLAPSPPS